MSDIVKQQELPKAAIEASLRGDWGNVQLPDRIAFVRNLCDSLGIPLVMNPFMFIPMKGKTALYAPASAFQMIAGKKGISTEILSKEIDKDLMLYEVCVRAKDHDERFSDNMAAISLKGLSGEDYANAKMKCVTKAQRRAIKSLVGLPIPDEDDIEYSGERLDVSVAQPELPALTDDEQEIVNWRNLVIKTFQMDNSPFFKQNQKATEYIKEKTGKTLKELNAVELEDLLSSFQTEFFSDDLKVLDEAQLDLVKQNILMMAKEK